MKYKIESVIEWTVMDLLWWMTAVLGTIYHNQHWFQVFAFLTWFLFIMWGILVAVRIAAMHYGMPHKTENRAVPSAIAIFSDLGIACLMAYAGHFVYVGLVVAQAFFEQAYFEKVEVKTSVD